MTQRIEHFSCMTQRIEPFWTWPNELNLLYHDSEKCLFLKKQIDSKNWNFLSMTQRIDFFECDSKNWIFEFFFFFLKRFKELSFSQKYDTKNWNFFQYDSKNWTFLNMTQWIEPFFLTWRKDFFPKKNSKNMTFCDSQIWTFKKKIQKMTQRIDPFFTMTLKMKFFEVFEVRIRLTELNFFLDIEPFFFWIRLKELKFSNTTQRIQLFFLWYDSKYWTFFVWLSKLNFFQEIWFDSSNWSSFYEPLFKMTQRLEVSLSDSKNRTFLVFQCDSKNWTFVKILKELNLIERIELCVEKTQRIEICFLEKWLKELNSL